MNLLPGISSGEGSFEMMDLLANVDDLEVFDTKVVEDFVNFNWEKFASHVHNFGALIHFTYFIVFMMYVHLVYQKRDFTNRSHLIISMFALLLYPMCYDGLQLYKDGPTSYFSEFWNINDQAFVWFSMANLVI